MGNRGAMECLVEKYYQPIYKYIYFKVSHKETAQDLTQEVFYKLTKNIHRFVSAAKFSTFLYQIAHNVVVDYYRSEKAMLDKQVALVDESANGMPASVLSGKDSYRDGSMNGINTHRTMNVSRNAGLSARQLPDSGSFRNREAELVETRLDLQSALNQLPENYRECITLFYIGQLKHREIAQILDVPVSTVKTWIRRGLDECKRIMKSMDGFEV